MRYRFRTALLVLVSCLCAGCAHSPDSSGAAATQKTLAFLHIEKGTEQPHRQEGGVCLLDPSAAISAEEADSAAASANAPVISGNVPTVQITENSYDFGCLDWSKDYVHEFRLKNSGAAPLEIKKVLPG